MFDLLFLVVVGVSTAFAALRGGLRELSTLLALAIAGGLTLLLIEPVLGATGQAGSFFGTAIVVALLIGIFFIASHIGMHLGLKRVPLEGRAQLIDRIGGGAFGFFRGLVLIGLGYLGYSYYLDEARMPDSVKSAITRPVAAGMANWFESFAPESTKLDQPTFEEVDTDEYDVDASVSGYERSDRNTLSEIVTTVTTTGDEPAANDIADQATETDLDAALAEILNEEEN